MALHRHLLRTDPDYASARARSEEHHWQVKREIASIARAGITVIPVVVHVVWKSESQNISDTQIQSQIEVLNHDFRKTNADLASVPAPFAPLAGDARIEFELATLDPSGLPTNGITRTKTTVDVFEVPFFANLDDPVKSAPTGAEPWPRDRYLNIWVCQLGVGTTGTVGYATLPGARAELDGVVIRHNAFGTTGTAAIPFPRNPANRGRTATHEIGHWLNLRHIWGDDGEACNGDDFVDDTPNAAGPNTGRGRAFPHVTCNNGPNGDMFMNYMDYTDDEAKFMFTHGQVQRMQTCLTFDRPTIGFYEVHRLVDRSAQYKTPPATGAPTACVITALGVHNIAYRDTSGRLHELWRDSATRTGTTNLTAVANALTAAGNPYAYVDTNAVLEILLFRGSDGHVRSLYWSTGAVGHDNLGGSAQAPKAVGDPVGYFTARSNTHHVIYRTGDGHLHDLWWVGVEPVNYGGNLTGAISAPRAAGDPSAFVNANGDNIVVYRSTDGQILGLYWKDGPSGLDHLSGVAGTPLAAGDPFAYYTPHDDTHQVVYRGRDGHLYELYWPGVAPVSGWDLTGLSGAPAATGNPTAYYSAGTNTKHVMYRSADGRLHEIWWVPGGGTPAHVDLTTFAGAPPAADRPMAFTVEGPNTQHVTYRGTDGHIYEIRWA